MRICLWGESVEALQLHARECISYAIINAGYVAYENMKVVAGCNEE